MLRNTCRISLSNYISETFHNAYFLGKILTTIECCLVRHNTINRATCRGHIGQHMINPTWKFAVGTQSVEPNVTLQVVYQRLMMSTYVSKWEQCITREELECQSDVVTCKRHSYTQLGSPTWMITHESIMLCQASW